MGTEVKAFNMEEFKRSMPKVEAILPESASPEEKLEALRGFLRSLGSVAVAFSSGVDSTFLLKVAHDELGDRCVAITACSRSFPARETEESREFCESEGIRHLYVDSNEMQIQGFRDNPPNRCYLCKRALFGEIRKVAQAEGMAYVAEGSNMDDNGDYRPGMIAIAELGITSPLRKCAMSKADIRYLSRKLALPTWKKPSFACLASRFVYGEPITEEKLGMVEKAEDLLMQLGFEQMRVRIHGTIARIELMPEDIERFMDYRIRKTVHDALKSYGFSYVSLDLMGYRMGSMNEVLSR